MKKNIVLWLVAPLLAYVAGCSSMNNLKDMVSSSIKSQNAAAAAKSGAGRVMIDGKLIEPPYRGPMTIEDAASYTTRLNGLVIGTSPSRGLDTAGPYHKLQEYTASITQSMRDGKFVCIDTAKKTFTTRESSDFDKTKQLLASDKTDDQKASELDQLFGGLPSGKDILARNK